MTNTSNHTGVREASAERPSHDGEPPRVFLLTNDFQTGGSERQVVTLARSLKAESIRLELGCIRRRGALLEGFGEIPEFPLGGSFLSLGALRGCLALGRHLRSRKIAIAHSFDFYSNLMMIPTARLAGVPVIIGSQRQLGDLLTPMQFGVQMTAFRMCDRVVCNSRAAASRLIDHGLPESKIAVIPNGIPDELFDKAVPAYPHQPGVVRVGMIARMNNPCKNHPIFLRAVGRLAQKFPGLEVLLVGDGPLRPGLQQLASCLGIANRVLFLGERHDIPAILASLDITVLPSFTESLSNSIIESMAAGIPVIATRVGGNPELISDSETGLLVPPDNEDRLIEALERFLAQPDLRAECARRARREAEERFSLARSCRRYERLYESLLREKGKWLPPLSEWIPDGEGPVRVAIVAASPRWIGGHGVQAESLIRHWEKDPDVEARFIPIDPEFPGTLAWAQRLPFVRTLVRMPLYLAELWRGIQNVDIVHIFSASYWSFLLAPVPAWIIAKLLGKRTLINYHSGEARDHLTHWRTALAVLRRVDRIVVPSQYLADVFRDFGLNAEIVPNLIDGNQFSFRTRRPLRPCLVCTRGFGRYYSVDVVVRAFAEVKKEFPEGRLYLVGGGPLEKEVRDLVAHLNLADVEFAGPVSRDIIGRFYDRSDIFINASWLDNMPISILEAFASGTPVVSTAPEGIRYLVQHERTGLLCAPGDSQALARNVIRLLRDPDLASTLANNAYAESKRYRWPAVRPEWREVYYSMRRRSSARREIDTGVPEEVSSSAPELDRIEMEVR